MARPTPLLAPVTTATWPRQRLPRCRHARSFRRPCSNEGVGGPRDGGEAEPRALRDVEQRVLAVGLVQHPQDRHLVDLLLGLAAHEAVHPSPAELRLALRVLVDVGAVGLEHVQDRQARVQRVPERRRGHQRQVVGGRVVLRIAPVRRAHQAADRQVEAGRTVLALVVAVRREVHHLVRPHRTAATRMPTARSISALPLTAPLVRGMAGIAQTRQHEPVLDALPPATRSGRAR